MNQIRPTTVHVDLAALRKNLAVVRARVGPSVGILAPVKGDAYGHGLVRVAQALDAENVDMFGVALVEEGKALRRAGIATPILCLGGIGTHGAEDVLEHDLTPMVYDLAAAERLDVAAKEWGTTLSIHLKVDTGMGRLGVPSGHWERFLDRLADFMNLRVDGICTHFAEADTDATFTREQARRFHRAVEAARLREFGPGRLHVANSAALSYTDLRLDLVRAGLALYGISGEPDSELTPVMRVTTEVLFVKNLPAGAGVSYGRQWFATRPTRLATLPVGYADGYPRALSNKAEVFIHGQRCPVRGRVCMDMILVDVTDVTTPVRAGDEVELLGPNIPATELAEHAGTIPYEIICGFSDRVPRAFS
ncbi:MAG: alanine racemase [Proteobacteria bacterium]|nr:alanine racemase [Pseudomonadota bacterium]MCP4918519.1 alanine racemase [Pseudomonadota bacterium]